MLIDNDYTESIDDEKRFYAVKKLDDLKKSLDNAKLSKGFQRQKSPQRIVIYQPSKYNQLEAIFYHKRNFLAHGRFAFGREKGELYIILEDGLNRMDKFEVRSRMILKYDTLLKWVDIIEEGKL